MPVLESPCFTPKVTHVTFIIGYCSVSYFIIVVDVVPCLIYKLDFITGVYV